MLLETQPVRPAQNEHELSSPGDRLLAVGLQYLYAPSHAPRGAEQGMSPTEGFTCSGFVTYLLPKAGIFPPLVFDETKGVVREMRLCADYERFCEPVSWEESRRGDLLLFTKRSGDGTIRSFHEGILLKRQFEGGSFLHAPGLERSYVEIDDIEELVPGHVWDQQELLPDYLQIRRIPASWDALRLVTPSR